MEVLVALTIFLLAFVVLGRLVIFGSDRAVEAPFPHFLFGLIVPQKQRRLVHLRLRAAATVDAGADGDQPLCLQVSEGVAAPISPDPIVRLLLA